MDAVFVVPSDDDRWSVKHERGEVVSDHDSQADAEQAGKDWARSHGGKVFMVGHHLIHRSS